MICFHYGLVAFAVAAGLGLAASSPLTRPFKARIAPACLPRRRTKQQLT